jgi:Fe-S-cluster-containing dehydrogenase component/DMSO reductase anchor subunit
MPSAAEPEAPDTVTLIDELLTEQRSLTVVDRFSRLHENQRLPSQARYYRNLIPLTAPGPGEQYAFEVDLDQCSGCKGCVTACHSLNGLEDNESWRDVGLLSGGVNGSAVQQTVTTACHHCVDPGCLNGCPVLAYEKDPLTGIVRHLDDQCIGCQYCVMKCPYDVPKYSERLGIVRKCDMCHQRLGEGEAPACVQACPNEAIKITLVKQAQVTARYRHPEKAEPRGYAEPEFHEPAGNLSEWDGTNNFLPGSPDPDYTLPTTRYRTSRPLVAGLRAADESALKPQHAHWPLVFLLVFSQASAGLVVAAAMALAFNLGIAGSGMRSTVLLIASAAFMAVALGIATLHLGRPMKAWRVFLGWRTSWFSREAIAFGGYLNSIALAAGLALFKLEGLLKLVMPVVVLLGIVSVFSSLMLYVDTRRDFWSVYHAGVRFAGTATLLGYTGWTVIQSYGAGLTVEVCAGVVVISTTKIILEAWVMIHAGAGEWTPLKRTARLILGPLRVAAGFRLFAFLMGGVLFPVLGMVGTIPLGGDLALICFGALLAGELAERFLFFTAVSPTQMPGGIQS